MKEQYRKQMDAIASHDGKTHEGTGDDGLAAHQRALYISTVRGFYLRTKRWGESNVTMESNCVNLSALQGHQRLTRGFFVDNISDIMWNPNGFEQLVLISGNKDVIYAFVQEQLAHTKSFDDIVEDSVSSYCCQVSLELTKI